MNFQDLLYFTDLVETQNFTRTAEKFYVSQPSISMAVKRLEKEHGVKLLTRNISERTLQLTPAGKILYERATDILELVDSTSKEIEQLDNQQIELGIPPIIGGYLLPKIIPALNEFSPYLEFVEEDGSVALYDLIKKKKVTTAIIGTDSPTIEESWLEKERVLEDQFYICVSKHHPLAKEKSIRAEDLRKETFVALGEGYLQHHVFNRWAKQHGMDLSSVHYTNEIQTANSLVASGMGVSLLIGLLVGDREDIAKIPLEQAPQFYIHLVMNKEVPLSSIQKQFNQKLVGVIRETFN